MLAGRSVDQLAAVQAQIADKRRLGAGGADRRDVRRVGGGALRRPASNASGRLDVLVNNAGVAGLRNLVDLDEAEWERIFDTNVRGMFLCSRAAGRHFATVGAGRVVNVASVFGLLGRAGYSAYGASKGAVINFTRAVAAEWARFGAQMNAVAPGYFATDINAELRGQPGTAREDPAPRPGPPDGRPGRAGQRRHLPRPARSRLPHRADHRGRRWGVERLRTFPSD